MKQSTNFHGGIRGANTPKQSRQFEGRFGRMFRNLPAAVFDDNSLEALAKPGNMLSFPETQPPTTANNTTTVRQPIAALETVADAEENFDIPAGYTYLGQFVDHDITFDPASSLERLNDPEALTNFRTPALDLDCLYGRGPDDQPYMYQAPDYKKFAVGVQMTFNGNPAPNHFDLPRAAANNRALIGDKRNDENVIISQLQGAFIQFHNRMANKLGDEASFEEIQREVRWHYQYVVLNDYLPKIVGSEMVNSILPHLESGNSIFEDTPKLRFYQCKNDAYIPIEFSVAAYRFGHSMVRPIYRLNTELNEEFPGEDNSLKGRNLIFAGVSNRSLNGFGTFPMKWAIDWTLFFGDTQRDQTNFTNARVQPSYKIDSSLVNPLGFLAEFSEIDHTATALTATNYQATPQARELPNLALRNLKRGNMMGLPSGQDVARAMGVTPLEGDQILIGKAAYDEHGNLQATPIDVALDESTPLWAYVLAEATYNWTQQAPDPTFGQNRIGTRLGEVGGRIVAETIIGLLLADGHSYLSQDPNWLPDATPNRANKKDYTMVDFLRFAGLY